LLATVKVSAQQPAASASLPAGNLEHGRYLVERVVMCYECHSARDLQGNIVAGTRFKGGPMPMRPSWNSDWPLQIPRIAGLPGYTDAEAMRLLTEGAIKRDGTQLRYPMPRFRMTPQDAADVIAYLRSL
jgi:mono/diheme cytochrome c family protein